MNHQSRYNAGYRQDAWGWCTGMTQRDGMGREVGGGFRMGNKHPLLPPQPRPTVDKSLKYKSLRAFIDGGRGLHAEIAQSS